MNFTGKVALALAGAFVLGINIRAQDEDSSNPYGLIAVRNIFNLNPVTQTQQEIPQAAVKITPNGIMTIFGKLQVLFKTSGGGPGTKEQSYILSEGQRQDDIEVLEINDKKNLIKFNNHGVVQELALADASPKGGTPASTSAATGFPSPNAANAGFAARGAGRFGNNNFGGNRRGRNENNGAGNENASGADTSNLRNVPTRVYQPGQSTMTPEEQVIMIEAQRAAYQERGDPRAKLLPPTIMTGQNQ